MEFSIFRKVNFFGFLICCFLLAASMYMQLGLGLPPCFLCVMQRLVVIFLAVVFLINSLVTPKIVWRKLQGFIVLFGAIIGIGFASWHLYLQSLPPEKLVSCGPDLSYVIKNVPTLSAMPLMQKVKLFIQSAGECGKQKPQFFYLTIPAWLMMFFILFAGMGLWQMFKKE